MKLQEKILWFMRTVQVRRHSRDASAPDKKAYQG